MASNSWITEALVQFIKSPVWLIPVNDFIDDKCNIFTDETEMKLEYTDTHQKFKLLIDNLLSEFVSEMGVSLEDAILSVRNSMISNDAQEHDSVEDFMKYIYLMDDFESFYRMMIKRNIELDITAVKYLEEKGVKLSLKNSSNLSSTKGSDPTAESIDRLKEFNGKYDHEEALKRAISASLAGDPKQQEMKLEKARINEMRALTAQAERDRESFSAADDKKAAHPVYFDRIKSASSKEISTLSRDQNQENNKVANSVNAHSHTRNDCVRQDTISNPQIAHTIATPLTRVAASHIPTTANPGYHGSAPEKEAPTSSLRALTSSKPQQPLVDLKLSALPPIKDTSS